VSVCALFPIFYVCPWQSYIQKRRFIANFLGGMYGTFLYLKAKLAIVTEYQLDTFFITVIAICQAYLITSQNCHSDDFPLWQKRSLCST